MYCRKCGYDLQANDRRLCSECGRPFDPDDPATYRSAERILSLWPRLFLANIAINGVCALLTIGFLWWAAEGGGLEVLVFAALLTLWVVGPYAGCIATGYWLRRSTAGSWIVLCASIAGAILSGWMHVSLILHPDAQGGLVFLFGPVYQSIAIVLAGVLIALLALVIIAAFRPGMRRADRDES